MEIHDSRKRYRRGSVYNCLHNLYYCLPKEGVMKVLIFFEFIHRFVICLMVGDEVKGNLGLQ